MSDEKVDFNLHWVQFTNPRWLAPRLRNMVCALRSVRWVCESFRPLPPSLLVAQADLHNATVAC